MIPALLSILAPAIKPLLDLIPNPAQKEKARQEFEQALMQQELELTKLMAKSDSDQVEVNKVEAASSSLFVSGWRPFLGWVCGVAFAYHYVLQPVVVFFLATFGKSVELPKIEFMEMSNVVMGMLGLGALRSWEKTKGVASK